MPMETSENGRIFQTAAWVWLAYLFAMAVLDMFIYANQPTSPVLLYYVANGLPALLFLGVAYLRWFQKQAALLAPLLVALITIAPILVNYALNIHLPPAPLSNVEGMILRQLPVLLIGLVLVAWRYEMLIIILYSLVANLLEVGIVFGFNLLDQPRLSTLYFIVMVRSVCMLVVGIFIYQLIARLRSQQDSLRSANQQLIHYASTQEDLAISRERNRMSRELHDTVVHTLSGLSVQLETAKAYFEVDPETASRLVDQSLQATRTGLQETRRAIKSLRASPLDDLGLVIALKGMSEAAAARGQFTLEAVFPSERLSLSHDVEQSIYRITQEALENIVHHANAKHACVRLSVNGGDVDVIIQDDGVGLPSAIKSIPGHFGIVGMKERAELVGGELALSSHPGSGTTVHLSIKGCAQ